RGQRLQRRERAVANHAKKIHIRELRMIVIRGRRSEQDDAFKVSSGGRSQPADKVADRFFRNHFLPSLIYQLPLEPPPPDMPPPPNPPKPPPPPPPQPPPPPPPPPGPPPPKNAGKKNPEQDAAKRSN